MQEKRIEKDLGVVVNSKLKCYDQMNQDTLNDTSVLGILKHSFVHWNAALFLRLYPNYLRPHLEYCSAVWNPCRDSIRCKEELLKLIPEMQHFNYELIYEYRLANLELTCLETKRDRSDLIEYFKIVKDDMRVNWNCGIQHSQSLSNEGLSSGLKGKSHIITRQLKKREKRNPFISNRATKLSKKLPFEIIGSKSTNEFKKHSARQLDSHSGRR